MRLQIGTTLRLMKIVPIVIMLIFYYIMFKLQVADLAAIVFGIIVTIPIFLFFLRKFRPKIIKYLLERT